MRRRWRGRRGSRRGGGEGGTGRAAHRRGGARLVGQEGGQLRRDLLHRADMALVALREDEPGAVGQPGQQQRQHDDGAARNRRLRPQGREDQLRRSTGSGGLLAKATNQLVAVEPEIVGIGAHEAGPVGRAGQVGKAPLLDRLEVGLANADVVGNDRQPEAITEPGLAKKIGDPVAA